MLTTTDVAARLGIDPSRVRRLAQTHGIGTKVGRDWLFTEADVAAMQQHSTGKPGHPPKRPH